MDVESWFCRLGLRSCDKNTKLFHNMFNCDGMKNNDYSFGRNKAKYCFSDSLRRLLLQRELCTNFTHADAVFIVFFDETTNLQCKKKIYLLFRYWC